MSTEAAIVKLEEAKAKNTGAIVDIDEAIRILTAPPPPVNEYPVGPGDNLLSMIADKPAGSTFKIDPTFVQSVGVATIAKPCRLESTQVIGPERVTPDLVGPQLLDAALTFVDDVACQGIRFKGQGQTIITTGNASRLDRCLVLGRGTGSQHRGVAANSADVSIVGSHIGDIWLSNDTQAVGCWQFTKRLLIKDSFLEASGENFMAGGSDCPTAADVPEDIVIEDCTMYKPRSWFGRGDIGIKNLYELKNCKRVTLRRCTMENNWADAQSGNAVVLTVRNQDGRNPWATIENVLIEDIVIKHVGGGFGILGRNDDPTKPSQVMTNVVIRRVTVSDFGRAHAEPGVSATGRQFTISGGPHGLTIEDCDFTGEPQPVSRINAAIGFDRLWEKVEGLAVRNCRFREGFYGITGTVPNTPVGVGQITGHAPGYLWENVTVLHEQTERTIQWPAGTTIINA